MVMYMLLLIELFFVVCECTGVTPWQLAALKGEIRRLERNAMRGSANLEYLKNIFVKFLESSANRDKYVPARDLFVISMPNSRIPLASRRMLTAISTILQFSPEELSRVQKSNLVASSWWIKR